MISVVGEFSWWRADGAGPRIAQQVIELGGRMWTPIERREQLFRHYDGSFTWEYTGFKPRWLEGPDPLMHKESDTKFEIPFEKPVWHGVALRHCPDE